ncbi:spore germination protein GerM [Anaerosolibacter carboniphilus]|uniref:Spore germination protein GerM n=1 Tax=Anaerosolibacter carboniphilus TaxID=1417629 RepID=A0A841KY24_9FIRM|nr:GerMN domain-containing protein [Anaerosolibacter carboniphilus]MBB6218243.1 spore germination protein GerM [Anaerosolibacter carboniphilus]
MKKRMLFLLLGLLVVSMLFVGCSKGDQKKTPQNSNPPTTSQEEKGTGEIQNEEEIDYVLYLKHRDKPYIVDEAYSIKKNDERLKGISIEKFVIQELIDFKDFQAYVNPIPKGTKLLSIDKQNQKVIVNLSKDFLVGQKGTSNDTLLSIGAIVNTLTVLDGIEEVEILVEGKSVEKINGIDMTHPFGYMEGLYPDK